MSDVPLKRCTGPCGQEYPATTEYWNSSKDGKHGLRAKCNKCCKEQWKEYRTRPGVKERQKEYMEEYRARPEVKEHSLEYMKEYNKEYYARPEVKEHKREYRKEYYARPEVKEHSKEYSKEYLARPEVKEHYKEYNKEHYARPEVKEHKREYRKEYLVRPEVKEYMKEYYKAYHARIEVKTMDCIHSHNRRVRKRGNGGTHTPEQIQDQLKRQKHKCYYAACAHSKFKKSKGRYIYHIEHVVPISRGGSNDISNIVLSCPHCNLCKNDKLLHEWIEGGRLC